MNPEKPSDADRDETVEIRLLGQFAISDPKGTPIDLPTQKARALLAMIVLAGNRGVDRAVAAANLWSRGSPAQARTNLRQTLASIRKSLAGHDIIDGTAATLRIRDRAFTTDIAAFAGPDHDAILRYLKNLGPLLDGIDLDEPGFSDWLTQERASLQRQVTTALFECSEKLIADAQPGAAQVINQKLIALDEYDETFIGNDRTKKPHGEKKGRGYAHKHKMPTLVDRGTGRAKSIIVDALKASTLVSILRENIAKKAVVYTDEAGQYRNLKGEFADHDFTRHGQGEYVRGEVYTNTVEGFYSVFKRGMKGVYQHCAKKHLHRYAAEFDFRYNNRIANGVDDRSRAVLALIGSNGKRLKYQGSDSFVSRA